MSERIAFETNDPLEPRVEIRIKAKVFPGVRFSTPFLDFGNGTPGTSARSTVKVLDGRRPDNTSALRLRHDKEEVSVAPLANSNVEHGAGQDENQDRVYILPVEMKFPMRSTEVSDRLVVTDETGYGLCSLPVYGRTRRQVEFYPAEVLLPVPGDKKTAFEKRCLCIADSGRFQITAKEVPQELSVEIHDASDISKMVVIRQCKGVAPSKPFQGKIVFSVEFDEQKIELVEVPVTILGDVPE